MRRAKRILKKSSPIEGAWAGYLKGPTPKSQTKKFSIYQRLDGKTSVFKSDAIDTINQQFLDKKISYERARLLCQDVLDRLRPKSAVLHNSANLDFLKQYWEDEYSNRDLVDRKSAWNRLTRAIESVGSCSVMAASREELQKEVDSRFSGNKQRAVVSALNQLLQYLRRPFKLRKAREQIEPVSYVTEAEMRSVLVNIKDERIRLMHQVAFGTGLRAGELFGLLAEHFRGDHLFVSTQMDVNRVRRLPKNRKERKALIIPDYENAVREWIKIPLEARLSFRKRAISLLTRRASQKALQRDLTFHDLRHSYCIYLISKGASLSLVAQSIGDSIKVTERYYSGFSLTSESIELLKSQLANLSK